MNGRGLTDRIERALANANATAAAVTADRKTTRERVAALEARPRCAGGRLSLTGMRGTVTVTVPLTTPMPDADYVASATLVAAAGLLPAMSSVDRITEMTPTSVTVQLTLVGALVAPDSASVHVIAVKG